MDNGNAKKLFQAYVDAATDLAESVKRNIVKNGMIDDKTVIKLNNFMIATNNLAEMQDDDVDYETDDENESDPTLN